MSTYDRWWKQSARPMARLGAYRHRTTAAPDAGKCDGVMRLGGNGSGILVSATARI